MSDSETEHSVLGDWICDNCKEKAVNPLQLEEQLLPGNKVFLLDSNNEVWLFCWGRRLRFHLKCVFDLSLDSTEEERGARYYCCFCEIVQ